MRRPFWERFLRILLPAAAGCSALSLSGRPGPEYHGETEGFSINVLNSLPKQNGSIFYADLGPPDLDVAAYPVTQQENYRLFHEICSSCHTPARALYSQRTLRGSWAYYVERMRMQGQFEPKRRFTTEEGNRVVDFLAYDSEQRKVRDWDRFEAQLRELGALYRR